MTFALPLDTASAASAPITATVEPGLPAAINLVAEAGPSSHAFLRRAWFDAAVSAYGGEPRTLVVRAADVPVLTLPFVPTGPRPLGAAELPGSYWPFRGFPAASGTPEVLRATLAVLAREVRALRIGPVSDGDATLTPLIQVARASGWAVLSRHLGAGYLLDMAALQAEETWPRNSTLRKNRFHEKHLAAHGTLDWRFLNAADWPAAFDSLASVEQASWIETRTDGSDAKFTAGGHGAFWRAAASDPVLARMFRAALLTVDGKPAAFSFDIDTGTLKYAIANSYDPRFAKHSPGKLLYWRNLVEALGRGITMVDWGMGDSGYKRVIGADEGPALRDWLLLRPGLAARIAPLLLARLGWSG